MPKQTFKWTIGRKLTLGFAAIVAVLLSMATTTLVQLRGLNQDRQMVLHHDMPMQAMAMQISGEVHAALSAHRGYIILGLDELKQDRAKIWVNIHKDVATLSALVNGDETTQAMVTELKDILDDFESSQMRIVQVAHTPANEPASVLFTKDTLPHGEKMREHLEAILAAEDAQDATPERRTLIGCVSNAELHLMRVTAAVAQYLNVATEEQLNNVHAEVDACSASVATLKTHLDLMTDGQRQDFNAYIAAREQYLANAKRVIAIRSAPDWNQAQYICSNTVTPLAKEAEVVLEKIIDQASTSTQTHAASLNERGDWVHDLTLYAAIGAVLSAIVIAWMLRRAICPPIIRAADAAKRVAEGDLTVQIPATSQDECGDLGRSFNEMVEKVANIIRHVTETSHEVNDASSQIADTAQEMASGMQAQSQQIAEVSRAVEDMALSVAEVADKSASAATNAQASGQAATDGGHVVDATVAQMRAISAAVDQSAQAVTQLGQRGQQIGQIVAVINDIAEQTNLLALNAAIESARAGEHGRGFAVVADEVRKLADRTTQATQEIAESITAMQSETQAAVDNMNTGSQQVTSGVTKASEAGTALGAIVEHANAVADMVQSIAATTQTQSATSERLNRNLGAITSVTAAAHEGSEHAAEAAMRLSDKSDELLRLVSQFKVTP